MLDDKLQVEKKEKMEYPPIPKDVYPVELLDVTAEEKATYETRNLPQESQDFEIVLNFQFTILKGQDNDTDLRCRNVWANFIPNYLYNGKNGKNKLWRIIEALNGKELTEEEAGKNITGYFLNKLIGKQCRITVEPKTKGDKTWDTITDWLKSNEKLEGLNEEERDKCQVKKKSKEEQVVEDKVEDVNVDDIPF